ncbi:MAG: GNAT family N-acetyltransferase [Promethearchaeota archaeon]
MIEKILFPPVVITEIVTNISIEQINPKADVPDLVALNRKDSETSETTNPKEWQHLSRMERWQQGGPWLDRQTLALHLDVMEEAGGIILIARTPDMLVGELELLFETQTRKPHQAFITWMVVHPGFRHQGIGSQLINHAAKITQSKGCNQLFTTAENSEATQFFEANDFQIIDQEAQFSKTLKPFRRPPSFGIQQIALQWKQREHTPMGFVPRVGINYTSEYIWSYLRRTDYLYSMLGIDVPRPQLWLLRQDEKEALTVDYPFLRVWLDEKNAQDIKFLTSVLTITEYLSWKNGVTQISAFSHQAQYDFFTERGYQLKQEHPFLTRSLS